MQGFSDSKIRKFEKLCMLTRYKMGSFCIAVSQ